MENRYPQPGHFLFSLRISPILKEVQVNQGSQFPLQ